MGGRGTGSGMSGGALTESEIRAIRGYTNTMYETINSWLRLGRDWEGRAVLADTIHNLDSAISKSSIDSTVVYRGVSLESLGISDMSQLKDLDGVTIPEKGFMSTSTSDRTAQSFVNKLKFEEGTPGVVVRIQLPKSKGLAMDVSGTSSHGKYENEILVSRGNAVKYRYENGILTGTIVRGKVRR